MDDVFKALADPVRRGLLDRLQKRDGQTLSDLCAREEMTRFGVMKHLAVLERAGLVVPLKEGREKLHFLNTVPIQRIYDRWVGKYAAPFARALSALKTNLESPMQSPKHVYEVYIRTTPDALWRAITDGAMTKEFFYGTRVESTWKAGAPVRHLRADGELMLDGEVIEVDRPRRLVHTFTAAHDAEHAKDAPSRVTWTIEPRGAVCKLTLVHDGFETETGTFKAVGSGWNPVLSGLKTLLETGKPLGLEM